jgi:hypothetical protein
MGKWRYSSTIIDFEIEVSGQLYAHFIRGWIGSRAGLDAVR